MIDAASTSGQVKRPVTVPSTSGRWSATVRESLHGSCVLAILALIASISMTFSFSIVPPTPKLDPSFVYSFNHAAATAGDGAGNSFPHTVRMGYLISTMDLGGLVRARVVFSLLLAGGTGLAVAAYLRSVPGMDPGTRVAMMVALVLLCQRRRRRTINGSRSVVLLFLMGFLGTDRVGLVAYALAGFLAGFLYVDQAVAWAGRVVDSGRRLVAVSKPRLAACRLARCHLSFASGFLISWTCSRRGLSDVGPFFTTGWEISTGYASAMSLVPDRWWIEAASFLCWFLLITRWVVVQPSPREQMRPWRRCSFRSSSRGSIRWSDRTSMWRTSRVSAFSWWPSFWPRPCLPGAGAAPYLPVSSCSASRCSVGHRGSAPVVLGHGP